MGDSMVVEIVVWSAERQRDIYLQEALAHRVDLLDVAHLHLGDPRLCLTKGFEELRIGDQLRPRTLSSIGRLRITCCLAREFERERCLSMGRCWTPVIANSRPEAIGTTNIERSLRLAEEIDPSLRKAARKCETCDRRHGDEHFKLFGQCLYVLSEHGVHSPSVARKAA